MTTMVPIGNAGFVELLETFGSDLTVVNAARVSFAKESLDFNEKDAGLIKYLAKHKHDSPFFHPQLRFRLRMPIFIAREWFRHQVGLTRNEVSQRYVDTRPECWVPEPCQIRQRDVSVKQGSSPDPIEDANDVHKIIKDHMDGCVAVYEHLLGKNVAPEVARCVLPQSMFTEFIETGSLAAYARLYKLRTDPHAQKEIRDYAEQIGQLIAPHFPVAWKALTAFE